MVEIHRGNDYVFIKPSRPYEKRYSWERITTRKASRKLLCDECTKPILKNSLYIRDKFKYKNDDWFDQIHVNFVCLNCWRGEVPPVVSKNANPL